MNLPTPILAGNWKLNLGPAATEAYFEAFLPRLADSTAGTIAIMPPAISLAAARGALGASRRVLLGVQNVYWEDNGAFTGEVSAPMAAEAGAGIVLIGHSERRHIFGETDAETALKVDAVVRAGLYAVLCVGEKLESREAGQAQDVVAAQLRAVTDGLSETALPRLLIAYEPVWAIGTGRTATPSDASVMHEFIRKSLNERYGPQADKIPILYGGSVKPDNAAELLAAPGVDGLLIGGASVDPASFAAICQLLS